MTNEALYEWLKNGQMAQYNPDLLREAAASVRLDKGERGGTFAADDLDAPAQPAKRELSALLRDNPHLPIDDATAAELVDEAQRRAGHTVARPGRTAIPVDEWKPKVSEYVMQSSLFDWRKKVMGQVPELRMLFCVPNGQYRDGQRPEAGLSASKGYPDTALDIARNGYHGLRIELKVDDNTLSPEQSDWLERLAAEGYATAVVYDDWRLAANLILSYLGRDELALEIN